MATLKDELTLDPLGRGYAAMTDQQAADSLNLVNRDRSPNPKELLAYVTLERFRGGFLYGRIALVANASVLRAGNVWAFPELPLGAADDPVVITQQHITAAATFLRLMDVDVGSTATMLDSRVDSMLNDLGPGAGCQAIGSADKTAIQALSLNKQSRAQELGIPSHYGLVRAAHIIEARG